MQFKPGNSARSLLALAVATGISTVAHAQDGAPSAQGLEEVIVTAERREASLQDTPISVLAFGTADLEGADFRACANYGPLYGKI